MKLVGLAAVAIAATTVSQLLQPAPMPKGTNVILGRVFDLGGDTPVAGAVVSLTGFFETDGRPASRLPESSYTPLATTPRSVLTTRNGDFVFRDLPAGRYWLSAAAFGFASNSFPMTFTEVVDSDRPVSVTLRLWKYGSISGTVVDEHGEPVVGVPVTALHRSVAGERLALRYQPPGAETDDRGVYRIAQLPPGSYVIGVLSTTTSMPAATAAGVGTPLKRGPLFTNLIRAGVIPEGGDGMRVGDVVMQQLGMTAPLAPDGRPLIYANALAPGTTSPREAAIVALGSGESREGVDVTIRFAPAVRVSGTVTGPAGPMATEAVRLVPVNGTDTIDAYSDLNPTGQATAITDGAGAFAFAAVPAGQYMLKVFHRGPEELATEPVSLWAAQPLTVGEKNVTGLAVVLQPGIRVRGRIEFKDAAAADASRSQPMAFIMRPIEEETFIRNLPVRPGSSETFVTAGDPPGRYIVTMMGGSDFSGWTLQSVSRGSRTLSDDVVDLGTEEINDLTLTFTKKPTHVSGTVVDPAGALDADTGVIVFPADSALWREGVFRSRRVRRVRATSAARFEFSALAPGDYYVAAISARLLDSWDDPSFLDRVIPGATKITLGEGADHVLTLRRVEPRR